MNIEMKKVPIKSLKIGDKFNRLYNNDIVTSFASLVESRDSSTGSHVKRTKRYVNIILDEMNKKGVYANILTIDFVPTKTLSQHIH